MGKVGVLFFGIMLFLAFWKQEMGKANMSDPVTGLIQGISQIPGSKSSSK